MTQQVLVAWTRDRPRALAAITVTIANRLVDLRWLTVSQDVVPGLLYVSLGVGAATPGGAELLQKRLNRLVDVVKVFVMTDETAHLRQGVLVKVAAAPGERARVLDVGRAFGAELVEVSATAVTLAAQARPADIRSLHEALSTFHVLDVMPLGMAAIPPGGRGVRPNVGVVAV
jgi:acetolactate synthase small subunit